MEKKENKQIDECNTFPYLPIEIWNIILGKVDTISVSRVCCTCKAFHNIVMNLACVTNVQTKDDLCKICKYRDHASMCKAIKNNKISTININRSLIISCEYGYYCFVKELLKHKCTKINIALEVACFRGNLKCIQLLINSGADDLNNGLIHACLGNQIDSVNIILEAGADNVNDAMYSAGLSGNMKIVLTLIEFGANDWNKGLIGACMGNHIEIIQLMIDKGATAFDEGYKMALGYNRCEAGQIMLDYGARNIKNMTLGDVDTVLINACRNDNIILVEHIIRDTTGVNINLNDLLPFACICNNVRMVKLFC